MVALNKGSVGLGLTPTTINQIRIPPFVRSFERIKKSVRNHKGEPFNPIDYPWTEGICDAWDDPDVRSVTMQFAARIGKTQLAQSLIVAAIGHDPATWMYGSATETLVTQTVRDKYYPMFERCSFTRDWVPHKNKRTQSRIDLATCVGYCGWSGSPVSMADKDPKYLHGGEIDKWSKNKSEEADSLELFLERGLEIPDRKVLLESTPSIKNQSRVELRLEQGWNCRWHVPCPKCNFFQELVFGDGTPKTGGIIFEKTPEGRLNPKIAYDTARYRCEKCFKEWNDEDRRPAVKAGIWVPQGQHVNKKGKVAGTMQNPGPDASFQLSRLYAPTFTFGDVARQFVKAQMGNEELMRNWLNSWMGMTWQPVLITREWHEVAKLLTMEYEFQTVPVNGSFITIGVDVQVDHWVFVVIAWSSEQRGYVVDWGTRNSWEEITEIIQTEYPHADGGPPMKAVMTLIDARDGNRTDEVVSYCRTVNQDKTGPWVWPCMGTPTSQMQGQPYTKNVIDDDNKRGKKAKKRKATQFGWIKVNTNYFQQWMHNCLFKRKANESLSIAFPSPALNDQDLWEQLMNEVPQIGLDSTGHSKVQWIVADESIPVDLRDSCRYARCGAEVSTRGNWARISERRIIPKPPATKPVSDKEPKQKRRHPLLNRKRLTNSRIGKRR